MRARTIYRVHTGNPKITETRILSANGSEMMGSQIPRTSPQICFGYVAEEAEKMVHGSGQVQVVIS